MVRAFLKIAALSAAALPAALFFFAPSSASAAAAEPRLHSFEAVSLSPDGRTIATLESDENEDPSKQPLQAFLLRDAKGAARKVEILCESGHRCTPAGFAWSDDSSSLAYLLRDPRAKKRALYVLDRATLASKRVLSFDGTLESPRFMRDGKSIAVLATAGAHKEVGATQAGAPIVGEIGTSTDEQRIAVVGIGDGRLRMVSPAHLFVYEYDLAPRGFVATAAPGNGDNNWWVAKLFFFAEPGVSRELYAPSSAQQQLATPRVSRDGKYVAFIGGIMSDFGSTGGDVFALRLDLPGAKPVNLTPGSAGSATSLTWDCRTDRIAFTELRAEKIGLATLDLGAASPAPRVVFSGTSSIGRPSFACDGTNAIVQQTHERPPELALGTAGSWQTLTHANGALLAQTRARSVSWKSDGFDVQGWLLEPLNVEAGKKYPLIVDVHGGPAAASTTRYVGRGTVRELLRAGYFVFFPNPRGSFGQGEKFALGNIKDFGGGDFCDIMAGVDAVEKIAPVDDRRLGIMGGSYGGYMTMWAVTQTNRFKAGVSAAGLSNWQSYYGENGIDEWMIPYFGASVYEDPAVYRKSSPIEYVKNAKTPTLIYVGERDIEVPAAQSLEFWHALSTLGVPTTLVIYPGEGHRLRDPAHAHDASARTLAWFAKYLK